MSKGTKKKREKNMQLLLTQSHMIYCTNTSHKCLDFHVHKSLYCDYDCYKQGRKNISNGGGV